MVKIFKDNSTYWSEKIEVTDKYIFYIICDKSKDKPYRWEMLEKESYDKTVGASFSTLDQALENLEEYKARLVAEKI